MRRTARLVAALLGVQAVLVGIWWTIERVRAPPPPFDWAPVDGPAPSIELARGEEPVLVPAGTDLVHFWATWCAPCQQELPELIDAAEEQGVPLLAVTDEPWPVVEAWFGGKVPSVVVRDPSGAAAARWGVSSLPDTWVVSQGRLDARVQGARPWAEPGAREFLRGLR